MILEYIFTVTLFRRATFRQNDEQNEVDEGIGEESLNSVSRPGWHGREELVPENLPRR